MIPYLRRLVRLLLLLMRAVRGLLLVARRSCIGAEFETGGRGSRGQ